MHDPLFHYSKKQQQKIRFKFAKIQLYDELAYE